MKNKKLKIAYISHGSEFGGGERSLQLLIQELSSQKRIEPVLVVPHIGSLYNWARKQGIKTYMHAISTESAAQYTTLFLKIAWWLFLFLREKVSLVHANDPSAARLCILPCKLLNIPLVCHIRFVQGAQYYSWLYSRLPKPDHFITISDATTKQLKELFFCLLPQAQVTRIYNAVDLKGFFPEIRFPGDNLWNIGIVANLQPIKGHEDFLLMARQILDHRDNIMFHVIGTDVQGQGRDEVLRNYAVSLGIGGAVVFHGFCDDVAQEIRKLDIVICPSHEEPFGRCVIEAMSCGKPVIASNVGGIPEIIEHEVCGILVPPKSPQRLAQCACALMEDQAKYRSIVNNALEKVVTCFSSQAYADANCKVYYHHLHSTIR